MTTANPYQLLPIGEVHESKHNPRKHFDGPALEQLAESIRKVGILDPLIVRPNAKGYELAAGHRRYRAAKAIGLDVVPCIVREMADQDFLEALTISNLQREDVHPLDEAGGYEQLMAAPHKMDVHKIAERVGKSVKYIYDRVKLLALSKDGRDLFWSGQIEAGHAILLARLTSTEQAHVIGTKAQGYGDGGLLLPSEDLYAEDEGLDEQYKACSVRELESWIKRHIRYNHKQVDAFLYPETAEQVKSAAQAKTKIIEITHEYLASDEVRHAGDSRVYGERAWKRADGKEGSKTCERSVLGVIASGHGQGEAFQVCINKDRCTIHYGDVIKAREKRAKQTPEQRAQDNAKALAQQKTHNDEHVERERKRKEWSSHYKAIRAAVVERVKKMDTKPTGYLVGLVVEYVTCGDVPGITRGKSLDDLVRYLAVHILEGQIDNWNAYEQFPKTAKALGVDLPKILTPAAPAKVVAKAGPASKVGKKVKGKTKKAA